MSQDLDIAAVVLGLVKAAGPGAADAEAEVVIRREELALTRFANSHIHQNVADIAVSVRLRLHLDGRTASGSTTRTDQDGLRQLVERTVAATRLSPPDPGWPGLAPAAALLASGTADGAVAAATPEDRAAKVRSFVDGAGGLTTAGYCRTRYTTVTFANSAGQSAQSAGTEVVLDGIARLGGNDGVARGSGTGLSGVDGALLGARAAAKARVGGEPVELPPGRYQVVLEPTAVHDVLRCLSIYGFGGRAVNERRSFARVGEAQLDPSVSIVDDATAPGAVGLTVDAEGTPKRPVELVTAGVTMAVAHDRRTAAEAGTSSTGHAVLDGFWGPMPVNLRLARANGGGGVAGEGGAGASPSEVDGPVADSEVEELVAGVDRGVLVTDHWYTRVLDPRTLVMTGLTRNGVWLIEGGQLVAPLRNMRFTQSYPEALGPGAVLGIGRHSTTLTSNYEDSSLVVPALRLASWNFTGGASG
jgi:predicted Zn-dependent protease